MSVLHMHAWCLPEESVGAPKTGVMDVVSRLVGASNQKWVLLESSQSS